MRYTSLRLLSYYERNTLYEMMQEEDNESGYRARIILLKDEGYAVPEIRRITNHHDINIRNWSYCVILSARTTYPDASQPGRTSISKDDADFGK